MSGLGVLVKTYTVGKMNNRKIDKYNGRSYEYQYGKIMVVLPREYIGKNVMVVIVPYDNVEYIRKIQKILGLVVKR